MQEKREILFWAMSFNCAVVLDLVDHGGKFAVMTNIPNFWYDLPLKII